MKITGWFVLISMCLGGVRAGAQEEPAELTAMRAQYYEALEDSVLPVLRSYGLALRRKMTEFTQAGKLDEALAFKKEMEKVAAEIMAAVEVAPESAAPVAEGRKKTIDFLEIIDTEVDGRPASKWLLEEGLLMCVKGSFVPKIILPYEPPEEYDFTITFEQPNLRNGVSLIMPSGAGKVFNITAAEMAGARAGIGIGGNNDNGFAKMKPGWFKTNKEYTLTAEVRKDEIVAKVDGEEIFRYDGAREALGSSHWLDSKVPTQLAISADDPAVITKVEVTEVTGTGKLLREK